MSGNLSPRLSAGFFCALVLCACESTSTHRRAGMVDYLYPEGAPATQPTDVAIDLPVRVGIAFVPETQTPYSAGIDVSERQRLLDRVVQAFSGLEEVEGIEVVPPSFVNPKGGFRNLDQLKSMFGIDLIVLVSYDQTQFEELTKASITYWTIAGAYLVPGNVNDTYTLVEAAIFDIPSRALLFNASGEGRVEGKATAVDSARSKRLNSVESFEIAMADMTQKLGTALEAFREQAKTGTVRGPGTPAISVTEAGVSGGGGTGVGGLRPAELGGVLLLVLACARPRRWIRRASA